MNSVWLRRASPFHTTLDPCSHPATGTLRRVKRPLVTPKESLTAQLKRLGQDAAAGEGLGHGAKEVGAGNAE